MGIGLKTRKLQTYLPMLETSVEVGIDLFKDLIFAAWNTVSGFAKEKYAENDPLGLATRRYVTALVERYNNIKVLGMSKPVPLKNLHVRVNVLEKISPRMGLSQEDLASRFNRDKRTFGKAAEVVDGEVIVNRLQKFIVLGKPGAGKTTYLRFLALMMLDPSSQIEQRRLPIFVTLREWAYRQIPLADFIIDQFDVCGFPDARPFLERMLSDGKCLVLFDGLDEVSQEANQNDIIQQINDFTNKYFNNQFVISCRVAAYNHWFEHFTDVEMADFNERQMETFIHNWFHAEAQVAEQCWRHLKSSPQLRELASTPLLLTLLCMEYHESNAFPANRAELYDRVIETLLTKWDASRRISRSEVYQQLSLMRKRSMFARIAFGTFLNDEYFIKEVRLAKAIEKYIENLPGFNPAELEPDSRAVLHAIEAQHGIFVERAQSVFSFAHLTFQEYFTAKYIVDNHFRLVDEELGFSDASQERLLEKIVDRYLYEPKWKEVFLLVAGMLDNADELLLLMRQKADGALVDPGVRALFQTADGALLPEKNEYPEVMRRWIVTLYNLPILKEAQAKAGEEIQTTVRENLLYALTILAWAMNVASIYEDLTEALARALGLDFEKTIAGLELHDVQRKRDAEEGNYNYHFIEALNNYFSSNTLILNCLETGCHVTADVRQKMIHDLFLVK